MQKRKTYAMWMMMLAMLAMTVSAQTTLGQAVGGPGAEGNGGGEVTQPANNGDGQSNGDQVTDGNGQGDAGQGQGEGEGEGEEGKEDSGGGPGPFGSSWMLLLMLGGFMVLWIFMGRSRKKQQQKRKDMLGALKKGDKVVTIGGILGTVMEVRPTEVSVKVDETNNTRMHFARWAIQSVGQEPGEESPHQR